jgi:carboxypeptidase family protein
MKKMPARLAMSCLFVAVTAAQAQYKEIPVVDGGGLAGRITVIGTVAPLPPHPVFKNADVCGKTVPDDRMVTDGKGGVGNVLVYFTGVTAGKPIPRDQPVTLDNVKCAFVPHVLAATVGQRLQISNSDPILHDAQALVGTDTLFNVAIPKGRTVQRPLATPGLAHINCNVRHTSMSAYLFVGENPYHTVTSPNGDFRLTDIPPGTYTLHVWHELLGSVERQVTIEPGKTATVDVQLHAVAPENTTE